MAEEQTLEQTAGDDALLAMLEEDFDAIPEVDGEQEPRKQPEGDDEPADEPESDDEPADDEQDDEQDDEAEDEPADDAPEPERVTVGGKEFEIPADAPEAVKGIVETVLTLENDLKAAHTERLQAVEQEVEYKAQSLRTEQDIQFSQQQLQQLQQLEAMYEHASVFATHEELAQIAAENPIEYERQKARNQAVQERKEYVRQHINGVAQRLEQQRQEQEAQAQRRAAEHERAEMEKLAQDGITRNSIISIFEEAGKHYGVDPEVFHEISDATLVRAIADANKYRALQEKARGTKKRVQKVSKQTQRKAPPRNGKGQFKSNQDLGESLIAGVWE